MRTAIAFAVALVLCALAFPSRSAAIPAFARKYETSCLTCHSVFPRLTPFGEAFRRNGFRFPGVDSDYVKQGTVVLGQEANRKTFPRSVWPGTLPASVPLAFGISGAAFWYPKSSASVPRANEGTAFSLDGLVEEGEVWAGGALSDTVTFFAEFALSEEGAELEHAQLLFNDLVGPENAVTLVVGKGPPALTSFGPHSTYLGEARVTAVPLTGIYGLSTDPFALTRHSIGFDVTGVLAGRFDYSVGIRTGGNDTETLFNSEDVFAHAGYKLGGMRLDGAGDTGPKDPMRPWAEDAVTLDVFVYHSREYFLTPPGDEPAIGDTALTIGGAVRGQLGSLELDVGAYDQKHDVGTAGLASVRADVEWVELSYVLYPWLVPALRVERIGLRPSDAPNVSDVHLMPGIAFLVRANVKAVLVANIEVARGFPADASGAPRAWRGGNAGFGGFVASGDTSSLTGHLSEFESVSLFLAWAI